MILSTSEKNGFCYVETAELDGETNLKCRQSLNETATLEDKIDDLSAFDGKLGGLKIMMQLCDFRRHDIKLMIIVA